MQLRSAALSRARWTYPTDLWQDLYAKDDMKESGKLYKTAVIAIHALVGWAYCGTLIGIGRELLPMQATLVVHALGAPVGFALISLVYYRKFAFTSP